MTAASIEAGHQFYLLLLEKNKVGSLDRLGGTIAQPQLKKNQRRYKSTLGRPTDLGDYRPIHAGTKEW